MTAFADIIDATKTWDGISVDKLTLNRTRVAEMREAIIDYDAVSVKLAYHEGETLSARIDAQTFAETLAAGGMSDTGQINIFFKRSDFESRPLPDHTDAIQIELEEGWTNFVVVDFDPPLVDHHDGLHRVTVELDA